MCLALCQLRRGAEMNRTGLGFPGPPAPKAPNIHPRSRRVHPTCRDTKNISARCTAVWASSGEGSCLSKGSRETQSQFLQVRSGHGLFPSPLKAPSSYCLTPQLLTPGSCHEAQANETGNRGSGGAFGKACFFLIERDRRSRHRLSPLPLLP